MNNNNEISVEDFMFKKKILGSMGKQMMEELQNPTKPKLSVKFKYKFLRWLTIYREHKLMKKHYKEYNKNLEEEYKQSISLINEGLKF